VNTLLEQTGLRPAAQPRPRYAQDKNMTQDNLADWLSTNCPLFWSFLNNEAQTSLPKGISDYIGAGSEDEIENGRTNFLTIEKYLAELVSYCGKDKIGDNYRRDLSKVSTEQTLSEIFCEIALCTKVASYSGNINLRPETGKGTYSDCKFFINGFEIYGEVKRYQDSWPYIAKEEEDKTQKIPFSRSICKAPPGEKPSDSARPRHMDIQSKLGEVHRQFPDETTNILFVFLPSLGQPRDYLVQAMLGENNFGNEEKNFILESDGLFAKEEWKTISACCLTRATPESKVIFPVIIENPNARNAVEEQIIKKLKNA